MNRRQKIIVSVTGIFLVLLLLVGLTYAYFLTKINGNENTKSISVTTANLALVYGDGNGIISAEKIQPGTTLAKKEFTVSNEGNDTTDYVVLLEDVKVTYASTVEVNGETHTAGSATTFESNDFIYTLTCTSGCNGVDNETTFPMTGGILVGNSIEVGVTHTYELIVTYKETGLDQSNDMNKSLEAKVNIADISTINPYSDNKSSLAYNIINNAIVGKTETQLVATPPTKVGSEGSYVGSSGQYQNVTMPEKSGRLYNTYDEAYMDGPYGGTAVSKCTSDAQGKYVYVGGETIYGPIVGCDGDYFVLSQETMEYEQVLSVTQDDYGTSYYYRGNVEDNYVNFAGMCWKIVRIEGDGSTKLILEDQYAECDDNETSETTKTYTGDWKIGLAVFGFDSNNKADLINYTGGLADSFQKFQTEKLTDYLNRLKADEWCYSHDVTETGTDDYGYFENYSSITRIKNKIPSLICSGKKITKFRDNSDIYVATLTADEVVFAGYNGLSSSGYNYLINDNSDIQTSGDWWTLTPSYYSLTDNMDFAFSVLNSMYTGKRLDADYNGVTSSFSAASRPSVTLKLGSVIADGIGTIDDPYVIE